MLVHVMKVNSKVRLNNEFTEGCFEFLTLLSNLGTCDVQLLRSSAFWSSGIKLEVYLLISFLLMFLYNLPIYLILNFIDFIEFHI